MLFALMLYPLIVSVILFFAKSVKLNNVLVISYALLHVFVAGFFVATGSFNYLDPILAPYFMMDSLSFIFLATESLVFLATSIYSVRYLARAGTKRHTIFSISSMLFLFSMNGVLFASHLTMLWIFIEASTIASAILIYFERTRTSLEAAWKYIFICSIGIALAFVGILLLSPAGVESYFFADLYGKAPSLIPFWVKLSFVFMMVGFGTKMGLAPVHSWVPDAYSESPSPISALISGTLGNATFLVILRIYKITILSGEKEFANTLFLLMGFLSLFVASVFIVKAKNYKRMLGYSSIEHYGILVIAIATGGYGIFAAMLHVIANSLTKSSLFLTAGNILYSYKSKESSSVDSLLTRMPFTAWLWIAGFLSIAGAPPSLLFISEFLTIRELFKNSSFVLLALFLIFLVIIFYGMAHTVFSMSFGRNKSEVAEKISFYSHIPQLVLLIVVFVLGVYIPDFLAKIIEEAAFIISGTYLK